MEKPVRECSICDKEKPLSEFTRYKSGENKGYCHSYCKECSASPERRKYQRDWYKKNRERLVVKYRLRKREWVKKNPEKVKEYNIKRRGNYTEQERKYGIKYLQEHKNNLDYKKKRNERSIRYYYKNKDKASARGKAGKAVKNGKLKKKTYCECCGRKTKLQKHHFDYNKPLEVVWLCKKCHTFIDQGLSAMETYYQGSELSVGEIENLLESKFNHLFSPEDNYSGRLALAKTIISARDKKRGE